MSQVHEAGRCEICGAVYHLLVACPRCGAKCCYRDLEDHGSPAPNEKIGCVLPYDWREVEAETEHGAACRICGGCNVCGVPICSETWMDCDEPIGLVHLRCFHATGGSIAFMKEPKDGPRS